LLELIAVARDAVDPDAVELLVRHLGDLLVAVDAVARAVHALGELVLVDMQVAGAALVVRYGKPLDAVAAEAGLGGELGRRGRLLRRSNIHPQYQAGHRRGDPDQVPENAHGDRIPSIHRRGVRDCSAAPRAVKRQLRLWTEDDAEPPRKPSAPSEPRAQLRAPACAACR